jgi:hypothetical protein
MCTRGNFHALAADECMFVFLMLVLGLFCPLSLVARRLHVQIRLAPAEVAPSSAPSRLHVHATQSSHVNITQKITLDLGANNYAA